MFITLQNKGNECIILEIQKKNNLLEMICLRNPKKIIKKFLAFSKSLKAMLLKQEHNNLP